MNVVLIPFFLAAQFTVQESEKWTRGAEITYRLAMTISLSPEIDGDATFQMNQDCVLKCRAKEQDTLVCKLGDIKIRAVDEGVSENQEFEFGDPFEMKFSERGVEHLVVAPSHNVEYLSIIRKAAAQLHVGCDLKNLNRSSFTAKENFTLGECDTTFNVTWFDDLSFEDAEDSHVKLVVLNKAEDRREENVIIEKKRDPKRCSDSKGYLSPVDHVVTSSSEISLENELFRSHTVTIAKVKENDSEIIREFVELRLESILEAEEQFPTISNGITVSLAVNEEAEHNFLGDAA